MATIRYSAFNDSERGFNDRNHLVVEKNILIEVLEDL